MQIPSFPMSVQGVILRCLRLIIAKTFEALYLKLWGGGDPSIERNLVKSRKPFNDYFNNKLESNVMYSSYCLKQNKIE